MLALDRRIIPVCTIYFAHTTQLNQTCLAVSIVQDHACLLHSAMLQL